MRVYGALMWSLGKVQYVYVLCLNHNYYGLIPHHFFRQEALA